VKPLRAKLKRITVRILTANEEWSREAPYEVYRPIWALGFETMNQLESPQYLLSKGFKKIGTESPDREFCYYCGAGIGKFAREGEGRCPRC
jgi:hypothetical protein